MELQGITNGQLKELEARFLIPLSLELRWVNSRLPEAAEIVSKIRYDSEGKLGKEVFRMLVERNRVNAVDMTSVLANMTEPGTRILGLYGVDLGRNNKAVENFELVVMNNGTLQYRDPDMDDSNCWMIFNPDNMIFFDRSFLSKLKELAKRDTREMTHHLENLAIVAVLDIVSRR